MITYGACGHPRLAAHLCDVCRLLGLQSHECYDYLDDQSASYRERMDESAKYRGREDEANAWVTTGRVLLTMDGTDERYRQIESRTRRMEIEEQRRSEQHLPEGAFSCCHRVGHTVPPILRPAYSVDGMPFALVILHAMDEAGADLGQFMADYVFGDEANEMANTPQTTIDFD